LEEKSANVGEHSLEEQKFFEFKKFWIFITFPTQKLLQSLRESAEILIQTIFRTISVPQRSKLTKMGKHKKAAKNSHSDSERKQTKNDATKPAPDRDTPTVTPNLRPATSFTTHPYKPVVPMPTGKHLSSTPGLSVSPTRSTPQHGTPFNNTFDNLSCVSSQTLSSTSVLTSAHMGEPYMACPLRGSLSVQNSPRQK
jgi:hypothetical protein